MLSNIVYYRIQNASIVATLKKINRSRGKKSKRKKKNVEAKGKPISIYKKNYPLSKKWYILVKSKCRKNKLELFLCKRSLKLTNLKLFNFIDSIISLKSPLTKLKILKKINRTLFQTCKMYNQMSNAINNNFSNTIKNIIIRSNKCIRSKVISTLLIRGNVEMNPGPGTQKVTGNNSLEIITYNCNGLSQREKRRRVLQKVRKVTNNGGIVMLQETHLMKEELISVVFKDKFQLNEYKSNSAGVATLYSNDYDLLLTSKDKNGRILLTVLEKKGEKYIVINVYCPNDHKLSVDFVEEVYFRILDALNNHPDCHIILAGDFNCCLTDKDYLNRNRTKIEIDLASLIEQNNMMCEMVDSYRYVNPSSGFTWNRGTCYSGLDYIFVSESLKSHDSSSEVNWSFDKSDHAAVITKIRLKEDVRKGPGISKVNTEVLKDPTKLEQIRSELVFLLSQIPLEWNGHIKLEYLKTCLRSTIAKYTGIERADDRNELDDLERANNEIEALKVRVLTKANTLLENELKLKLAKIEIAKNEIVNKTEELRNKISKQNDFKNAAKWYEYGEKSNKFFLNLNKFRGKQKLVDEIKNGDKRFVGHNNVIARIREFYSELYKAQNRQCHKEDKSFFENCPKISEKDKITMENNISLSELSKALKTCKDTSPGPDGIPYSVYKIFWPQVGTILKEAWDYSLITGQTPDSHKESVITILPKEGKDLNGIKNWRPITLTNCDAKIITKALANRINPILETIIDPSQTAYVPGRSVMDNIRANMFTKQFCHKNKIEAVLTSLDAKKAFDSVNHSYIDTVLEKYGFGQMFREYFKIIYKDLTAKVLVNGYLSEKISIERGVKQGDALSCSIFILCIDPLIRNINKNDQIKPVQIRSNNKTLEGYHKACGFADDISIACMNDRKSVNLIFSEYQRLTDKSGLTLNADKTEIIKLNPNSNIDSFSVQYENEEFSIKCVNSLKICGITFSNNKDEEYNRNVSDKIVKLKRNLKLWQTRHLTMEGKALIVKTFGLAQIIYSMQCTKYEESDIKRTEQYIFNFLWNTKDMKDTRARDRIKRAVMKNDYKYGGP